MSILKDLDPQYAKLHAEPWLRKPFIWAGVALLALGGGYWVATQSTTKAAPAEGNPLPARQASTPSTGTPAHKGSSADSLLENTQQHTLPTTPAVATIREESKKTGTSDQQAGQAAAGDSPARTSLASTEYPPPPQSRPAAPAAKVEHAKRKPASNQTVVKNEKTPGASGKKSGERDIDIITAIVR